MDSRNNWFLPMGGPPVYANQCAPNQWPIPVLVPPVQPCHGVYLPYLAGHPGGQTTQAFYQVVPEGRLVAQSQSFDDGNPVYLPVAPPPPPLLQVGVVQPVPIDTHQGPNVVTVPLPMPSPPQPLQVFVPAPSSSSQEAPDPFPFGSIDITVPVLPGRDGLSPKYLTISLPLADPATIPQPRGSRQNPSILGPRRSHTQTMMAPPIPPNEHSVEGEGGQLGNVQAEAVEEQGHEGVSQADIGGEQHAVGECQEEQTFGGGDQSNGEEDRSSRLEPNLGELMWPTDGQDVQASVTDQESGQENDEGNGETEQPGLSGGRGGEAQRDVSAPHSRCKFCKSNGETWRFYKGHNTLDKNGKTVCPVLRRLVCKICGASGDNAHTLRYCPQRQQQQGQGEMQPDQPYDARSAVGGYVRIKY